MIDLERSEQDWREIEALAFDIIEHRALKAAMVAYDNEIARCIDEWMQAATAYRD